MITVKTEYTPAEAQLLAELVFDLLALCEIDDDLAAEIEEDVQRVAEIIGIFPAEEAEDAPF